MISSSLVASAASHARHRVRRRSRPAGARRAHAARTRARRPMKRRQCSGHRSGRSIPGEETSSTYRGPTIALDSRKRSSDRLIPAQSAAVTPWPGWLSGRSTRTCRMGRPRVPARRRSTSSNPRPAIWSRIEARSASANIGVAGKKMWGNSPTSTVGPCWRPRTAQKYYPHFRVASMCARHPDIRRPSDRPRHRNGDGCRTLPVVRRAPAGGGDDADTEPPGLVPQMVPQI